MSNDLVILSAIVFTAFMVEAAAGFGSMLIAVTVGVTMFPLEPLLAWLVPVNITLSTYLVSRGYRVVAWRFLFVGLLPLMIAGLIVGTLLRGQLSGGWLKLAFGVFVMLVGVSQLRRKGEPKPLTTPVRTGLLLAAGLVHGVFATGGPLAVVVASREIKEKAAFRATLSCLWGVLNGLLIPKLPMSLDTLRTSALMLPALGLGIVVGEIVHRRLDEARFRKVIAVMLVFAGGVLAVKQLVSA
ncbi:MAG: sulfite exporter TauE/SafE family protein [Archangium sp.]|nr:sulfite exporter TauE/SafE family protein [Archangium sp.]